MSALLDLAERCEAASGPDTTLDCLIENEAGLAKFERDDRIGYGDADYSRVQPKPYTASLDAAMTLVPEGYRVTSLAETIVECDQPWRAILWERKRYTKKRPFGDGASAALALCAAALRARAAEQSALNREGGK